MTSGSSSCPVKTVAAGAGGAADAHSPVTHVPEYDAQGRKIYRCGTLTYTKRGLLLLFAWLLWGDFCFTMMETVIPSIMPLKLRALGSANWIIATIMSTLPGVFNTTICPWVSFKSDHHRSRWGRRMPFIIYTMPFLTASLLFIGFSDTLGAWLHAWMFSGGTIKQTTVVIFLMAVFVAMFDLFNMFVGSVYSYLFNDVVPEQFLCRFFGWFRLVGVASGAIYNYFIFQYALSHMQLIYTCAAALYFVGFGIMCFKVKEGEYPPPPDGDLRPSLKRDIKSFASECFTSPFYWFIFLNTMFAAISSTIGVFTVFFYQSMGLDLNLIGKTGAISGVAAAICLTFSGILADRWNPVRVDAYTQTLGAFLAFTGLIWIFIDPPSSLVYFWVSVSVIPFGVLLSSINGTAYMPRLMQLFPKGRFGAFCGAMALVRSAGTMIGGLLAGVFLDIVKRFFPDGSLRPYRYMSLWQLVWGLLAYYCCYRIYRFWKRMGGDAGFTAPLAPVQFADLPKARDTTLLKGMLVPLIISWCGTLLVFGFYCFYFIRITPNPHSAMACGVMTALVLLALPLYLRFLHFMERP